MTRQEAAQIARRVAYHYQLVTGAGCVEAPCLCWLVARAGVPRSSDAAVRCGDCEEAVGIGPSPGRVWAAVVDYLAALRGGALDD